jgi:ATP-binding cassette, subfamily B, bacterial MsbA
MANSMKNLKRLFSHLRPYLWTMTLAACLLMAVAGVNLAMLWIARDIINSFSGQTPTRSLNTAVGFVLVLLVFQALMTMGHSYLVASVGQRVVMDFRVRLFTHLTGLSVRFFNKRRTGELMSRLTSDVQVIQNFTTDVPINLAKQMVTLTGGIAILFYINSQLCLLIIAVLPLIALTGMFFGRRLKKLSAMIQDQTAEVSTSIEETVSGIRVVKSFVAEPHEQHRFRKLVGRITSTALTRAWVLGIFIPFITLLTFGSAVGIMWYGAQQVQTGVMTPGDLIAFLLYGGILIGPFGAFAHLFSQVKEVQGATQRVFEILDTEQEVSDLPQAIPLPMIVGKVAFRNVSFQYDPETPVLQDITFQVRPGTLVALVGPSGAGKSTLIQLLHRFYDPVKGSIEIDGQNIRKVLRASLFSQIGFVPQETHLFGGTIHENILYGRPHAIEEEMIAAARAANAHDFIERLPKGYDTVVGEKGILLSGGQRQRIAIARAILKKPKILILDEATSSLDNESEALIQEALDRLMVGRTTFVIAHRLTTIQKADQIFVMDHGRIVETGSHQDLMSQRGFYHYLYTLRLAGIES